MTSQRSQPSIAGGPRPTIEKVTVALDPPKLTPEDEKKLMEANAKASASQ